MKDLEKNINLSNREDSTGKKEQQHAYKSFIKDKRTKDESQSNHAKPYVRKEYGAGDESNKKNQSNPERREGGYNRDGASSRPYNRDNNNSGERREGGYNRDGASSRPYNRDNNNSGERREGGYNRDGANSSNVRRSFNPNFTLDNKPFNHDTSNPRSERPYEKQESSYEKRNNRQATSRGRNERGNTPRYNQDNYPTFPVPVIEDKIRLNRYISMSGICSRREADEFIQSGMVTVNGVAITELGAKVAQTDEIHFNGNLIKNEKKVYIVMNKPKGFVTSLEDPHAERTVMDLLRNGCRERVYPVGRLDKNSLGVLLITNDGDLAKKLTHPSFEKKKVYQVSLDKPLTRVHLDTLVNGFELEDGEIHADAASYVGEKKSEVGIEIHSGRNRIVRRMFEHLGYKVVKLDRVYFAGLTKQRLKRGDWRFLGPREVQSLLAGQYE